MPLTVKMVASEIMMCGLKRTPIVGTAVELLDSIRLRHELVAQADRVAEVEAKMSRFERGQRDLVAEEIRTILNSFQRPDLSGQALTEEIRNLHQIQDEGWSPSLFEGLLLNSSHLTELKSNPQHYGRLLADHDQADPAKGIHLLLDADKTRILELPHFAFSQLLAHQSRGIPEAKIKTGEGVWAFPNLKSVTDDPTYEGGARPWADSAAKLLEELEQFRGRFAQADPKDLRGVLFEFEDLLIHVCGQSRFDALRAEAERVLEQLEECRQKAKQRRIPDLWATEPEWVRLAKAAGVGDELKRRVAGIQYRK
jgi:hypothetical protein